ncbi:MAG TPA: hypothetical protein VFM53_07180 [Anaeromyxobacteraceae bacterium]|nr:hypothetical protein [Anaeromyxobacteraceae bacterium]
MRPLAPFAASALVALTGCATVPAQTRGMEEQGVKVSSEALRLRLRAEAIPFTGLMEQAADGAREASPDPAVRRRTIVWKVNVVPALYRSLFAQRPLLALLDTWALLLQVEDYLQSEEGRTALGPGSAGMLDTTRELEGRVREIAAWAAPGRDLTAIRAHLADWASKHPVRLTFATRESIESELVARAPTEDLSAMAVAGRVSEDVDGLVSRVDFLPVMVPRQATWQAELTYLDLVDPRLEMAIDRAGRALDSVDEVISWLGTSGLEEFATQQRRAAEAVLASQTRVVEQLVQAQREGAQAFVAAEWREALVQLRAERVAAFAEARALADHAAEEGARRAREVVDALVLRLAVLAGVVALAVVVAAVVLRRRRA